MVYSPTSSSSNMPLVGAAFFLTLRSRDLDGGRSAKMSSGSAEALGLLTAFVDAFLAVAEGGGIVANKSSSSSSWREE